MALDPVSSSPDSGRREGLADILAAASEEWQRRYEFGPRPTSGYWSHIAEAARAALAGAAGEREDGPYYVSEDGRAVATGDQYHHGYRVHFWCASRADAERAVEQLNRTAPEAGADRAEREDAERWRAVRSLLVGADFQWGDPPQPVIVFAIPNGISVGADADKFADDVRAARPTGAPKEGDQ